MTLENRMHDKEVVMMKSIWGDAAIEHGATQHWQIGPLSLWVHRIHDEFHIAWQYFEEDSEGAESRALAEDQEPEDINWNRYIVNDAVPGIRLRPAFPDRPVLVTPEYQIMLAPGSNALFFVSIPVWVQLLTGGPDGAVLVEIPSQLLSNNWFGDTLSGELCYAVKSRARRELNQDTKTHLIRSPVTVRNRGTALLDLKQLYIHVEHLRVYGGKNLWANEVILSYTGGEQPEMTEYSDKKPSYDETFELLNAERIIAQNSFLKKSFGFMKTVTKMD
jgi:hypothetical protein